MPLEHRPAIQIYEFNRNNAIKGCLLIWIKLASVNGYLYDCICKFGALHFVWHESSLFYFYNSLVQWRGRLFL